MFDRYDIMDMECARKVAEQRPGYFEAPCSPRSTAVRQNLQGMRSLLQFKVLTKTDKLET